jgi:mono/diheme cytochrome c family protein
MAELPLFPRWVYMSILFLATATAIPFAVIAYARHSTSTKPRIHIIRDMDNQERFKAQQANELFVDGRAMRPPVPGTVARGELGTDAHMHRGLVDGKPATTFPAGLELDDALLARGQERYEIFCAMCHGRSGYGDGMVDARVKQLIKKGVSGNESWATPASYHADAIRDQPVGELFATVSWGKNNMAGYASQIPVRDRWAIVFYVKALQYSQKPE